MLYPNLRKVRAIFILHFGLMYQGTVYLGTHIYGSLGMYIMWHFAKAHKPAFTQSNINSGFQICGLYPLNPDIFSNHEFLPSNVTDRPNPSTTSHDQHQNVPPTATTTDAPLHVAYVDPGSLPFTFLLTIVTDLCALVP